MLISRCRSFEILAEDRILDCEFSLLNVNFFAGDAENFYPKIIQSMQRSQRPARLQYGFAVFSFIFFLLAHFTEVTIRDGALSCDDANSKFLSEKEISIMSYLPGYLFGTFYRRTDFSKSGYFSSVYYQQSLTF